ncbi:hypothetical protein [Pontibacillus halophilus]|uniref:hypothetical protein n=1 Tax=Pontibacillus halophilus TaxID=516704 RepID=UPI00040ED0A4|nr:hypothetical protein [Pontibacillus halophilus]
MEQALQHLSMLRRNREITSGIVRSVGKRKMPVEEGGKMVTREVETAIFNLKGGFVGFCPIHEFGEQNFSSLTGFVGTTHEFIIEELISDEESDTHIAIVSVKKADKQKKEAFWDRMKLVEGEGALDKENFEGYITGYSMETRKIYVKVNGQDCFMNMNDWDHERYSDIRGEVQRNMTIPVKVLRFKEDTEQVQVSRKAAIPDPFQELLKYEQDDAIVGRVSAIDPRHGIFVQLDNKLELKGTVPRQIPDPVVGEKVSCKIRDINVKERKGRVVIIGYPEGKKKVNDLDSFLYAY